MTNNESNLKSKDQHAPSFPLGLCVASIAGTSLGLIAAAVGVKWGAAPEPGDALRMSWVYVQVMLGLVWLVAWPAMRKSGNRRLLPLEGLALALGALPAIAVAATLSAPPGSAFWPFILGQAACGLVAMGVLALTIRRPAMAIVLPALALAGPVVVFLWSQFFPSR